MYNEMSARDCVSWCLAAVWAWFGVDREFVTSEKTRSLFSNNTMMRWHQGIREDAWVDYGNYAASLLWKALMFPAKYGIKWGSLAHVLFAPENVEERLRVFSYMGTAIQHSGTGSDNTRGNGLETFHGILARRFGKNRGAEETLRSLQFTWRLINQLVIHLAARPTTERRKGEFSAGTPE